MQTVYQESDKPECGAACLAMLSGCSIKEARKALFRNGKPRRVGRRVMIAALRSLYVKTKSGKAVRLSRRNGLRALSHDALVFGSVSFPDGEAKHWMVWDAEAGALHDPLGFSRPLRITSYTEVV